jgi:hypothetical protein
MTPKQKADKLCIDFLIKPNTTDIRFGMDKQLAKQCALIAVDEIVNVIIGSYDYELEKIYWQDVKNEIELL